MVCYLTSVEELLFIIKKCAQSVLKENRSFKPLYYEGAGLTLPAGFRILAYATVMHNQLDCG
jgi:hypothetical protein